MSAAPTPAATSARTVASSSLRKMMSRCAVARQERGGEEVGAERAIRDQRQSRHRGRVDARGRRERMVVGDEQHVGIVEQVDARERVVQRRVAREDDVEVAEQGEIGELAADRAPRAGARRRRAERRGTHGSAAEADAPRRSGRSRRGGRRARRRARRDRRARRRGCRRCARRGRAAADPRVWARPRARRVAGRGAASRRSPRARRSAPRAPTASSRAPLRLRGTTRAEPSTSSAAR